MQWNADVDGITQKDFMEHVSRHKILDVGYGKLSKYITEEQVLMNDQVGNIYIRRVAKRMREENISTACNPHLTRLLSWMLGYDTEPLLADITTLEAEEELIEKTSSDNISGFALKRFGPRLYDIFAGKVNPLELLIQDDLLGRVYSEYSLFSTHYAQAAEYMQAAVHKNPHMKVLEIGAGTGSATMPLLSSLDRNGRLPLDGYTYTDISSGFFERARERFGRWTHQMDFKTLDISRDPLTQGYAPASFDTIVASLVLHATPLMEATMTHVRKLLKPGGRLILIELTELSTGQNAVFGTLEGWWMAEDGRQGGPLLTVPEWDEVLKRTGFSGTDLVVPAFIGTANGISSVIVTRATATPEDLNGSAIAMQASVRLGHFDTSQTAFGDAICQSLANHGVQCNQQAWNATGSTANEPVVVIDSAEHPLLLDPTEEEFEHTKQLLLQGKNVLWVSYQSSPPSGEMSSLKNMVTGMARVIRRENPSLRLITLDVRDPVDESGEAGSWSRLLRRLRKYPCPHSGPPWNLFGPKRTSMAYVTVDWSSRGSCPTTIMRATSRVATVKISKAPRRWWNANTLTQEGR